MWRFFRHILGIYERGTSSERGAGLPPQKPSSLCHRGRGERGGLGGLGKELGSRGLSRGRGESVFGLIPRAGRWRGGLSVFPSLSLSPLLWISVCPINNSYNNMSSKIGKNGL